MSKTALITGASSGIGYEFSKILYEEGYKVILVARNKQKLDLLAKKLGQAQVIEKDLSSIDAAQQIFEQIDDPIDVLINNAGFGHHGAFANAPWKKLQQMVQVNITSLTELTHLYLPQMLKRKSGKIVHVASTAAFQPGPLMAVYYATKAYVLHLSEALTRETKGTGVTITALCPGPTASKFQLVADIKDPKLIEGKNLPSSKEVALYGYQSMIKGKTVAIPGWKNRLLSSSYRFLPRKTIATIIGKIQTARL
ncbi:SDR family NAD(P)-dependent oxidoreductase [Candidatus Uabimicrobium sp. HlEnr_7]|uniref:SDR family NAD(P)-dependent oxidoreductase n=1 Tax=Candidatus Uabimicrobium helgolandensis TaxID=3095367 RepID=UPI003557EAD6